MLNWLGTKQRRELALKNLMTLQRPGNTKAQETLKIDNVDVLHQGAQKHRQTHGNKEKLQVQLPYLQVLLRNG